MKKFLSLLIILSLCLSLCACGGTGNKDYDYIISLLEEGNYDMAIHVIEGLRDIAGSESMGNAPDSNTPGSLTNQSFELVADCNGSDWMFNMDIINNTDSVLTIQSLEIVNISAGQAADSFAFTEGEINGFVFGETSFAPNEGRRFDDGHPVVDFFDHRDYIFRFTNEQGEEVTFTYMFDMSGLMPTGGSGEDQQPAGDWTFPVLLENTGTLPIELFAMDITEFMGEEQLGTYILEGEEALAGIGLAGLVLQPGDICPWVDGHPATDSFDGREYRFHFVDQNGQKQTQSFRFDQLDKQTQAIDYSQDGGQDLKTLRHDADFELEVYPGVYWVPANSLGVSRYSNMDISQMTAASPEDKQNMISTLYEALQLYQIGGFTPSDDNIRIMENGINWEHHKPGYHAVRTNTGCCATDSNWLRYILDSDYEQVGFIATSQRDGSGHVYNYIFNDGWYYFIDLTHYHVSGTAIDNAVESGDINDYRRTDYILGNIHKTRDVQAYVDYVQQSFNDPPGLMFMYSAENVLAVDGAQNGDMMQIVYEEAGGLPIDVIFDDKTDVLEFVRAASPAILPDWAAG